MPLYCSALGAVWPLRQESGFFSFCQPAICMNISAATAEPLRGRRQTIPPRPLRSSLPSPFPHHQLQNPIQRTRMVNEDDDLKSNTTVDSNHKFKVENQTTECLGTYRRDGRRSKTTTPTQYANARGREKYLIAWVNQFGRGECLPQSASPECGRG